MPKAVNTGNELIEWLPAQSESHITKWSNIKRPRVLLASSHQPHLLRKCSTSMCQALQNIWAERNSAVKTKLAEEEIRTIVLIISIDIYPNLPREFHHNISNLKLLGVRSDLKDVRWTYWSQEKKLAKTTHIYRLRETIGFQTIWNVSNLVYNSSYS